MAQAGLPDCVQEQTASSLISTGEQDVQLWMIAVERNHAFRQQVEPLLDVPPAQKEDQEFASKFRVRSLQNFPAWKIFKRGQIHSVRYQRDGSFGGQLTQV